MRKGGLAGIHKGELMTLLRPNELAAIALREPEAAGRLTRPTGSASPDGERRSA